MLRMGLEIPVTVEKTRAGMIFPAQIGVDAPDHLITNH